MIVFRVERYDGIGPYARAVSAHEWCDNMARHWALPEPDQEEHIRNDYRWARWDRDWLCGFANIHDLKRWFTLTELHRLSRIGFHLAVYDARTGDIIQGAQQLVFRRAKKITHTSLLPVGRLGEEFSHGKRAIAGDMATVALSGVAVLHGSRYAAGGAALVRDKALDLPSYLEGSSVTNQYAISRKEPGLDEAYLQSGVLGGQARTADLWKAR